jgi:iron complex outermembrane recepter protein
MKHWGYQASVGALAVALTVFANTGNALAQNSEATGIPAGSLEEIIVTARKTTETLQDTPISITAFTAKAIEQRNLVGVTELASYAPNVEMDTSAPFVASTAIATVFIRGIGQNNVELSVDPGVGIYVDGVYLSRSIGQALDLIDIERIEVLRGPQGTLFGRNTIGGAINISTRRPGDEVSGSVSAQTGTDFDTILKAYVNGPLSDRLRAGASVLYRARDNYIEGSGPNAPDRGKKNALSARLMLDFDVTDTLTARLNLDGTRVREPSGSNVAVAYFPGSAFGEAHNAFFSGAGAICADPTNPARLSDPRCYNSQWLRGPHGDAATFQTPESHQAIFVQEQGRRFENQSNLDLWGTSLTLDWQLSDAVAFKSITAYRDVDAIFSNDGDHSPHLIVHAQDQYRIKQLTQELQLTGKALGEKLQWIVGGFYYDEDSKNISVLDTNLTMFLSGAIIATKSYALFGQATYELTDRLSFTGGLRWTDEKKTFNAGDRFRFLADFGLGLPAGFPIIPFGQVVSVSDNSFTPLATLSFKPNDDLHLYASYSQGRKGGGFTQKIFPATDRIQTFTPEENTNYELGFKFFGLDRRLRLNGAAFYGDYKDIQITVVEGVAPTVRNAAKGRIKGFELEMEAALSEALRLDAAIGYLDAKFTRVAGAAAAAGVTTNNRFVNAPEWTLSAGASYTIPVGNLGDLVPRVDWSYRSKVFNDAANSPAISQPGYHVFNASLALDSNDDLWRVSVGVKNLGDKEFLVNGYSDPAGIGAAEAVFDRGRQFYATVRRNF